MIWHCTVDTCFISFFFTDEVYTPEDIARQFGMDVEKSLEYSDTWEKPFSGKINKRRQHSNF